MCWKYENEYDVCFDYAWIAFKTMLSEFNADSINDKELKRRFFSMLEKVHKEGVIKPYSQDNRDDDNLHGWRPHLTEGD